MGLRGHGICSAVERGGRGVGCWYKMKVTYLRNVLELKLIGFGGLLNIESEGRREMKAGSHFSSLTDELNSSAINSNKGAGSRARRERLLVSARGLWPAVRGPGNTHGEAVSWHSP